MSKASEVGKASWREKLGLLSKVEKEAILNTVTSWLAADINHGYQLNSNVATGTQQAPQSPIVILDLVGELGKILPTKITFGATEVTIESDAPAAIKGMSDVLKAAYEQYQKVKAQRALEVFLPVEAVRKAINDTIVTPAAISIVRSFEEQILLLKPHERRTFASTVSKRIFNALHTGIPEVTAPELSSADKICRAVFFGDGDASLGKHGRREWHVEGMITNVHITATDTKDDKGNPTTLYMTDPAIKAKNVGGVEYGFRLMTDAEARILRYEPRKKREQAEVGEALGAHTQRTASREKKGCVIA